MHDPNHDAAPFNAIPPLIVAFTAVIALIEARFQLGAQGIWGAEGVGWRVDAITDFGFLAPVFDWMVQNRQFPPEHAMRIVTYPFIHYDAMHAIFACVLLLAMGKFVAERFAQTAVVLVLLISAIAGALAYGFLLDTERPLVGFYPAVYGLIGAYTFTLLLFYEESGQNRLQAFQLIAILVILQLLFNLIGGGGYEWVADIAGFIAGFLVSFAVAPGGSYRLRHLLDRTRDR